jgi:hypothetical protein
MDSGDTVIVEMDEEQLAGFSPAALDPSDVAATVTESFETAVDRVLPAMRVISERMRQLAPAELTVAVGVKLTAEAGVILAKAAAEANFTVTLMWRGDGAS